MAPDRRYVLGALTLATAALSIALLWHVLATVFFAVTVAYLLAPVHDWYERRGLPNWWASVAATVTGLAGLLVALSPLVVVVYLRTDRLIGLIDSIPSEVSVTTFGYTATVTAGDLLPAARAYARGLALGVARAVPELAIEATVFGVVVFALLLARQDAHRTIRSIVPEQYHDVVAAMGDRARETLFAIYVLQAATAVVAFAIALPLFVVLGYPFPFTLATLAGVLQFIPIVGPSVLIVAMVAFEVVASNLDRAVLIGVLGFTLIAYLPDPLVRPRLARKTADLPGSLYFVGFTGGLFTLGVVGIIAGPLAVALFAEAVDLLAEEMDEETDDAGGADDAPDPETTPDAPAEATAGTAPADDPDPSTEEVAPEPAESGVDPSPEVDPDPDPEAGG